MRRYQLAFYVPFFLLFFFQDRGYLWAFDPKKVCALHTSRHEHLKGIPRHLLAAIAKVESGHYDKEKDQLIAWPWTVNAEGKSFRYSSKRDAVTAVRKMQRQGVKSIDVGCMQVNLLHHKGAFKTLEDAFDPRQNVDYAAHFLTGLKKKLKSWTRAVAHYHSATPEYHRPYRKKVYQAWRQECLESKTLKVPSRGELYWARLRERARTQQGQQPLTQKHLTKVPRTRKALERARRNNPHWSTLRHRSTLSLTPYRARAQSTLVHHLSRRKKHYPKASDPVLRTKKHRLSQQKGRYASVRARAKKLLNHSKASSLDRDGRFSPSQ